MTEKLIEKTSISFGAIILGALIGTSCLITIAALAGALMQVFSALDWHPMKSITLVFLAIGTVTGFIVIFFFVGLISGKLANTHRRFDIIMHSLGAWSLMSILIISFAAGAAVLNGVRNLNAPLIETYVHLTEPVAVTKIKADETNKKNNPKEGHADKDKELASKMMKTLWWTVFFSLLCGAGGSAAGGQRAFRKISRISNLV